jgi:hypothetical protein
MIKFEDQLNEALRASAQNVAYRVTVDEPVGIAIDFRPKPIRVDGMPQPSTLELDKFRLEADDGGNAVFISNDGRSMVISGTWTGMSPPPSPSSNYTYPEPVDLMIWRSQAEFEDWITDYYGY